MNNLKFMAIKVFRYETMECMGELCDSVYRFFCVFFMMEVLRM